jgi:hypothetical protein
VGRRDGVLRLRRLHTPTYAQASVPEALGGRAGPALGCGISKSEVSRIRQVLDVQVQAFLIRPLEFVIPTSISMQLA